MRLRPARRPLLSLVLLPLCLGFSACKTGGGFQGTGPVEEVSGEEDSEDDQAEAAFKLKTARAKLELAELSAQRSLAEAEQALREAERELAEAQQKMAAFTQVDRPQRQGKAELAIKRAQYDLEEAQAELAELEAMYAEEQFAAMTKELVLQRGRRALEVATLDLELERLSTSHVLEHELPMEQGELEWALAAARDALSQAQQKLLHTKAESQLEVDEARHEVSKAEKAVQSKAAAK
jgi:hypothetical protein